MLPATACLIVACTLTTLTHTHTSQTHNHAAATGCHLAHLYTALAQHRQELQHVQKAAQHLSRDLPPRAGRRVELLSQMFAKLDVHAKAMHAQYNADLEKAQHTLAVVYPCHGQMQLLLEGFHHPLAFLHDQWFL